MLTFGFLFLGFIDIEATVDFNAQIAHNFIASNGGELGLVKFIVRVAARVTLATQEIPSAARPLTIRRLWGAEKYQSIN